MSELPIKVAVLETRVAQHDKDLAKKVDVNDFTPVRKIVYGIAGITLLAVAGAVVKGVVLAPHITKVFGG